MAPAADEESPVAKPELTKKQHSFTEVAFSQLGCAEYCGGADKSKRVLRHEYAAHLVASPRPVPRSASTRHSPPCISFRYGAMLAFVFVALVVGGGLWSGGLKPSLV